MFTDFSQIHNSEEIFEREAIMAEMNASEELFQMADMVEAKLNASFGFSDDEIEFLEEARLTAEKNPVSETAFDVREKLLKMLRDLR